MIGPEGKEDAMWLLKTEPSAYSYENLERDGKAVWDGITNPVALKNLRAMKEGEKAFVYHTGDVKAVVGIAVVARGAYPDPKAKDPNRVVVDVRGAGRLKNPVSLAAIKSDRLFADSPLVRQGRLSVVPLTPAQWQWIEKRGR
jgi:predicted RNA-binding protein with PUA-like domain